MGDQRDQDDGSVVSSGELVEAVKVPKLFGPFGVEKMMESNMKNDESGQQNHQIEG